MKVDFPQLSSQRVLHSRRTRDAKGQTSKGAPTTISPTRNQAATVSAKALLGEQGAEATEPRAPRLCSSSRERRPPAAPAPRLCSLSRERRPPTGRIRRQGFAQRAGSGGHRCSITVLAFKKGEATPDDRARIRLVPARGDRGKTRRATRTVY
jgi:hypothetical protein